ncbi:SDR family NAD(P)-dependent oxidoreductase, partial [Reinekea blandensis]
VFVASLAADVPTPQSPLYGPTKAYVKHLAATLYSAYRKQGVGVIAVCPGFFRSDFHAKLGLQPEHFYRKRGLLKALDADQVAHQALIDLDRGRLVSVSGWNYRLLYTLLQLIPDRLMVALSATRTKARL